MKIKLLTVFMWLLCLTVFGQSKKISEFPYNANPHSSVLYIFAVTNTVPATNQIISMGDLRSNITNGLYGFTTNLVVNATNNLYQFTTNLVGVNGTNSVSVIAGANVTVTTNFVGKRVSFTVNGAAGGDSTNQLYQFTTNLVTQSTNTIYQAATNQIGINGTNSVSVIAGTGGITVTTNFVGKQVSFTVNTTSGGDSTNGLYQFTTNLVGISGTNSVSVIAGTNVTVQTNFVGKQVSFTVNSQVNAVPAGSDTQVQFNDAGSFGGDAGLVYDKLNNWLTVGAIFSGSIVLTLDGGSTQPEILFDGDGDSGIYDPGGGAVNGAVGFTIDGTGSWMFGDSLGNRGFYCMSDNGFDIGKPSGTAPSAYRPRNIYIGSAAVIGTKLSVSNNFATPTNAQTANYVLTASATGGTNTSWSPSTAGVPGGADTQVQFNDAGTFGGDAAMVWNKTTDILTMGGADIIWSVHGNGDIGKQGGVNSPNIYGTYLEVDQFAGGGADASVRAQGMTGTGLWWPASQVMGVMINHSGLIRFAATTITPEVDGTVSWGAANAAYKNFYVKGVFMDTNDASGFATVITNGVITSQFYAGVGTNRIAIAATGYTNTMTVSGQSVDVDVYFSGATATLSDSAGNLLHTYVVAVTGDTYAKMKPNWRLVGTSLVGDAIAH